MLHLAGCTVLLAGERVAARHAGRQLEAESAVVHRVSNDWEGLARLRHAGLLVICDKDPARFALLTAAAHSRGIPVSIREPSPLAGSLTLVGGGPGALDLLTLRAVTALQRADVVFHDRLGPGQHLHELAPQAQLVDVGKQPGHHKVTQRQIEEQMIAAALKGQQVARLKGGDPFVFGRGFEEVAAATAAGISVHVVPGLSSAISVPAAAGIPVTSRSIARGFTVISGHDPFSDGELDHLAGLGASIVILMGMGTLEHTVAGLLRRMPAQTACAIVEQGTTARQKTTHATLSTLTARAREEHCANPAVIVIGEVARLPLTLGQFTESRAKATA
ncbi:uroporphyrinogen-III C-methyltransferase [Glutamicibacter sp. MNS18]|uniref:uroporphyrinogen-III C-methyltransferase n=1 Tax=Glutamicibacter sp. MNS18 TaxID=2989817 RepID=UPI0022366F4F|nr:uroporphyrinogen-III C-methyltransferase [Glutamicibacter sp. MNS18]MCW4465756.1 uroporphyrinogen-III C-methyltransferase [Glutamicibacter sp. MNS18]